MQLGCEYSLLQAYYFNRENAMQYTNSFKLIKHNKYIQA